MAKRNDNRVLLKCTKCSQITYNTTRNKKNPNKAHLKDLKLSLQKYCRHCRVRTEHKETKKK